MQCKECGEEKHRVIRTWKHRNDIMRVRRCLKCKITWTTTESIDEKELKNRT